MKSDRNQFHVKLVSMPDAAIESTNTEDSVRDAFMNQRSATQGHMQNQGVVVPFSPPDIGEDEIAAVVETLRSGWITTGPRVQAFQVELAAFCGTGACVALSSATAALEMTLRYLGIGPGDEVITSSYTFSASASAIHHVGATIRLVDICDTSPLISTRAIERMITPKTKAIIGVDVAGLMADYSQMKSMAVASQHFFRPSSSVRAALGRIAVISDAAHSLGACRDGLMSGQAADFTCFSFHAVKNLTTAEGGAITWPRHSSLSSDEAARSLSVMSLHGQSKSALEKSYPGQWEYDVVTPGFKCNMTDITASIARVQLKRYPAMLNRRAAVIDHYDTSFAGLDVIPLSHCGDDHKSSCHLYMVDLNGRGIDRRNHLIRRLAEMGVSANVHYKPLPLLTAYRQLGFRIEDYPNAERLYQNEITLPLFSRISDAQVERVIESFKEALHEV